MQTFRDFKVSGKWIGCILCSDSILDALMSWSSLWSCKKLPSLACKSHANMYVKTLLPYFTVCCLASLSKGLVPAATQEALVDAAGTIGTGGKTGVFVGCMWSHEFLEVLPQLVRSVFHHV